MNLTCNCEEQLEVYLCDIPHEWKRSIIRAICDNNTGGGDGNGTGPGDSDGDGIPDDVEDLIENCETVKTISSFTQTSDSITFTFTDEHGNVFVRSFKFTDLIEASLDGVDPKCLMSQEAWLALTHEEKLQAIFDYKCTCCPTPTTTSTTTTTTVVPHGTIIIDDDTDGDGEIIIVDDDDEEVDPDDDGDYECTGSPLTVRIHYDVPTPVSITVLVDGEIFFTYDGYVTDLDIPNVPDCANIVVLVTNGTVTTTTSTSTTETTNEQLTSTSTTTVAETTIPPHTTTSSTTTTTTEGTTSSTTTFTTLNPECPEIEDINVDIDYTSLTAYWGWKSDNSVLDEATIEAAPLSQGVIPSQDITCSFSGGSATPQYLWMAEPLACTEKTKWEDTIQPLNNGNIGPSPDAVNEPVTSGGYRFYIWDFQTQQDNPIKFKVS